MEVRPPKLRPPLLAFPPMQLARFCRPCFQWLACCALLLSAQIAEAEESEIQFARDVAPLLVKHCLACHGTKNPEGDYQLHTPELMFKAGASESMPVTPGKPDESELLRLIASDDPDERMPKDGDPLATEAIETIRRWIAEGAKYEAAHASAPLVSIVPRAVHPDPPTSYPFPAPITALAFHPAGEQLAASGYHEVTVWNASDGALLRRFTNIAERTYALDYSPDGSLLAVAGGNPGQLGEVRLVDPATGEQKQVLGPWTDVALDAAFSPDGTKLAVAGADRTLRVFGVATASEELLIEAHADWVTAVAWSPDSARLASGSRDKTAKAFDAKTGSIIAHYPEHDAAVYDVLFSADGAQLISSDGDREIHFWKVDDPRKAEPIRKLEGLPLRLARRDDQLFAGLSAKCVRQYTVGDRKFIRELAGHADAIYSVTIHAGTGRIAAGSHDGHVSIWDAEGKPLASFKAMPDGTARQP